MQATTEAGVRTTPTFKPKTDPLVPRMFQSSNDNKSAEELARQKYYDSVTDDFNNLIKGAARPVELDQTALDRNANKRKSAENTLSDIDKLKKTDG